MPPVCRFVDEALGAGGVVLIHGVHGLSRGATIMAAYGTTEQFLHAATIRLLTPVGTVMWSRRMSAPEALDTVRRRKPLFILVCIVRFSPTVLSRSRANLAKRRFH
jgi:dual specificity phosphatase 12